MNILILDGGARSREALTEAVRAAAPQAAVQAYDAGQAPAEAQRCDVAFLDLTAPGGAALALAERLRRQNPRVNLIFLADRAEELAGALDCHASGFLLRPITPERVRSELGDLRYPPEEKRVRFQTFGNFEVFVDGAPLRFRHGKTKEYLAYLVDRGTLCSNAEVIAALWEDRVVTPSYFRLLRKDLADALAAVGCAGVLLLQRGLQGLDIEKVSCDLYDFKRGLPEARRAYRGEYMSQYSWAEFTLGSMEF